MAEKCSPPKKLPVMVPGGIGIAMLYLAQYSGSTLWSYVQVPILQDLYILVTVFFIGTGLYDLIWNRIVHPKKMDIWDRSYYCQRCGAVTIL